MKKTGHRTADRVENLISSIDAYEPQKVREHEDLFRVFARFMSRSLDGRYLERHPPQELLPDIEELMSTMLVRQPDEIKIKITMNEGDAKRGVLTLAMPDQFFIFSTVTQGLENMSVEHHRYLNSAVQIKRSATGTITSVSTGDATPEVFIWLEIEGDDLKNRTDEVITHLQARLEATQAAVEDFPAMESLVVSLADHFDDMAKKRPDHRELHSDNARLLRWMMDHHFVLLGIKVLKMTKETPMLRVADLGVGRLDDWRGIQLDEAESAVRDTGGIAPFLWIRKSNTEAWTYRPGRMDHVLVQCFDKDGSPAGILVIEGLFSYNALSDPCAEIPILDRIVDRLYTQWSAERGSHLYRAIRNAFNSLPLEYLFPLEFDDIQQLVERALHGEQDQTLQTHITTDEAQNTAFVFVSLPRTNYSDELRMDIRRLLMQTFKASSIDDGVFARGDDAVYIHFFLIGASTLTAKETDQMQDAIAQLAKPWHTRFKDALTDRYGKEESEKHHDAYSEAFPASYREGTSVARAATDIEYLDGLSAATPFDCDVYREKADKHLELSRLRMFHNTTTQLSDIMPILDNFGLVVQDQSQTPVRMPGTSESIINTFRVSAVRGMDIDLTTRRNRLRAGIRAVVSGAMSNDSYNQLLLRADVPWNYVALIRAYENYSRQIGIGFGPNTILDVMLRHSNVVRALTELFRAKFDPDMEGLSATEVDSKREEIIDRTRRALLTQIEGISDLTSDQILRFFHNLVESTVRTNFYARDPWEKYRIVVKFDPAKIDRLPFPRPFREIYVHHPKVAGVHLRGGPVARGGIRWSDRPSDYRTEILGLVHTQNLKNVVIVPKGSKGGFILRNPPADMGERRAAADHYYKEFIGGLLDVTDNLVKGKIVTPERVIAHEGKDHYLVVAADKGTAHLSDTANGLSADRGFWLGDAFASGGSIGYDHKKEAITAKGAWESVKRHFHEMGMHPEKDKIRVVGIGDMSGDVFGNGMLLSKSMQVVAAFDHRHVFLDPNPDPQKSWEARAELFKKVPSSWEDYPTKVISKGGGVYPRRTKSIELSPEAQKMLSLKKSTISGPDLVKTVLRMKADLLWNGGIGTYVRASYETDIQVGDAANDGVRIDATEIRVKVIGEGGNLGLTQEARIELAGRGVHLYTDALDNSGGVDMSDHEVNTKILLHAPLARKGITPEERNSIVMDEVRPKVGAIVLNNNWTQSRMVSLDSLRSKADPQRFGRAITFLGDHVPFSRRELHLPGERVIRQRAESNEGLYYPELAILASNAKMNLKQELEDADVFTLESLRSELMEYFPQSIVDRFENDIWEHPLAPYIARTILTNQLIDDLGSSWLSEATLRSGRPAQDIILTQLAAYAMLDAKKMKSSLDDIQWDIKAEVEYAARLAIEGAAEKITHWMLRRTDDFEGVFVDTFRSALKDIKNHKSASKFLSQPELISELPEKVRTPIELLAGIDMALDATLLAMRTGIKIGDAIDGLLHTGKSTGLVPLVWEDEEAGQSDGMESPARFALTDQLRQHFVCAAVEIQKRDSSLTKPGKESIEWMKMIQNEMESMTGTQIGLASLALMADRVGQRLGAFKAPVAEKPSKGNTKGKTKAKSKSKSKSSNAHA